MARLKRLHKVNIETDKSVRGIYINYFVSLGLYVESDCSFGSEQFAAAFLIKFGSNEYRRAAWLSVRSEVKKLIAADVYTTLNAHFTNGTAEHFTHGFDYETRMRLKLSSQCL